MSLTTITSARGTVATGALAGLGTGVLNLAIYFVAKAAGVPFVVQMGPTTQPVPVVMPFVASFVALLLGALVLKLLARSARGVTIWTALAVVVFLAYTGFALSAATSISTGLALTLMHVLVLGVALAVVVPTARRATQA